MEAKKARLDWLTNQYKMAMRHDNYSRAALLETEMHELETEIYGISWCISYRQSSDEETLVTVIVDA